MSLVASLGDLISSIGDDYRRRFATSTVSSTSTITPPTTRKQLNVTALGEAATIDVPTGVVDDGQSLMVRVKDDGVVRALSWNAVYRPIGVTLPTTTVASKTIYIGCVWNMDDSTWDVLAVGVEE